MKPAYDGNQWTVDARGYSIRNGYEWVRPKQAKYDWCKIVCSKWNYPKHALISWIVMNNGVMIKERLFQFNCCTDDRCWICDSDTKTQSHLFYDCQYSKQVLRLTEQWCGFRIFVSSSNSRTGSSAGAGLKQTVHNLIWTAYYYYIWNQRINFQLLKPGSVADKIKEDVRRKIRRKLDKTCTRADNTWLQKWGVAIE
ncbi:uncharacterized protein LOC141601265 [Silene latifolia]|uniref:uncharacterized protein LOC141601265 n=1 Tax=Silene latifolia TaxID=37657 RepID=UPI003D76BFAA